jgi:hypothetical protein
MGCEVQLLISQRTRLSVKKLKACNSLIAEVKLVNAQSMNARVGRLELLLFQKPEPGTAEVLEKFIFAMITKPPLTRDKLMSCTEFVAVVTKGLAPPSRCVVW